MEKRIGRKERIVALALIILMICNSLFPLTSSALTGEVTSATQATIQSGSINWGFTMKDTDGKVYDATCMEPQNQSIPSKGNDINMYFCSRKSVLAWIAYLGKERFQTDTKKQQYIISRAAALQDGNVKKNNYIFYDEVNDLYDAAHKKADAGEDVPESFIVYTAKPVNGSQKMLAWRSLAETKIKLRKTSETETDLSLAGAKYGVYTTKDAANSNNLNKRLGILTTKKDGSTNSLTVYFSGKKTFYVKEISAPEGFELDETVHSKTLEEGGSWTFVSEEPLIVTEEDGKLRVIKSTNVSPVPKGYSLAGAVYGIYTTKAAAQSGSTNEAYFKGTVTTKESGYSNIFGGLEAKTYYVKEISCPDWLELDTTVYDVMLESGEVQTVYSMDPLRLGKLQVQKHVQTHPLPEGLTIAGAKYGVYDSHVAAEANENEGRLHTLTTDEWGTSNIVTLEPGRTYYVREYACPNWLSLDPQIYQADIEYGQKKTLVLESVDEVNPGYVQLKKTTKTLAPYSRKDYSKEGAQYGVYTSEDDAMKDVNRVSVLKTDADGNSNKVSLLPGTYYVREFFAPLNLELDEKTYKVVISPGETETVHSVEPIATGFVKVKKCAASDAFVLDACPEQYSLAGAKYGIYVDKAGAENDIESKKVGLLVTDEKGESEEVKLTVGRYWIKELEPSPGFCLDGQGAVEITVSRNQKTVHSSNEPPLLAPISILIDKEGTNEKENRPSLAGGQFEVSYYGILADSVQELESEKPKRTWYFETKEEHLEGVATGVVRLQDAYKVSGKGDFLYKSQQGIPVGLIGSYVITEIKAPKGYTIDDRPRLAKVEKEGTVTEPSVTYKNPTVLNAPKEFSLKLVKVDAETENQPQGEGRLTGAVFGLYRNGELIDTFETGKDGTFTTPYYNIGDGSQKYTVKELSAPTGYLLNDTTYHLDELDGDKVSAQYTMVTLTIHDKVIKNRIAITKVKDAQAETGELSPEPEVTFEIYLKSAGSYKDAKETERDTITTNERGFAQTKKLPYGRYTVHQVNATVGHDKLEDFDVFLCENHETADAYSFALNNDQIDRDVRVIKKDRETGNIIPVAGAKFKIRRSGTIDEWVSFTMKYPNLHVIDTFETDETGTFQLPGTLPFGQYELIEQLAPEGYVLCDEPVSFAVDGTEKIVEVVKENRPQKGQIKITKMGEILKSVAVNEDGNYVPIFEEGPLAGAVFEIFAKTDVITPDGTKRYSQGEKVDTVTTDKDGNAVSQPLYLGQYEIKEVTAGKNHVLNENVFEAELTYDPKTVQVCRCIKVHNKRQKAEVTLEKKLERDPAYGYRGDSCEQIRFGIYADEKIMAEDQTCIPEDALMQIINVTARDDDYSGTFTLDLPHGKFYVKEVETEKGYLLDNTKYAVEFDYKDQMAAIVNISLNNGIALENKIIRGDIEGRKVDEEKEPLEGAIIGLFKGNETVFTEETALQTDTSDKYGNFGFEDVAYGKYLVREIQAPKGYVGNRTLYPAFITEDKQTVSLEIVNKITKCDIKKVDMETGDFVIGAHLTIIPMDGQGASLENDAFVTWLSEDKAFRVEGLTVGKTYILREITAPAGYEKTEDVIFTVENTAEVQTCIIKNKKIALPEPESKAEKVPQTGEETHLLLWEMIIVLSVIAFATGIRCKYR